MNAPERFLLEPIDLGFDDDDDGRACRECGCTAGHACYRPDLGTCSWADRDLCSHCLPLVLERRRRRAWRAACLVVLTVLVAALVVIALRTADSPRMRGRLEAVPHPHLSTPIHHGVRGAPWAVNA